MANDPYITDSRQDTMSYNYESTTSSSEVQEHDFSTDSTSENVGPAPSRISLVGTAHVSEKSIREVKETIHNQQPDVVAVELCKGRYDALKGKTQTSDISVKELLAEGKIYFFLVHMLLAHVQKRIGKDMGVQPGAEMLAAIEAAEEIGADVALVDRDIQVTLQRFWGKMGLIEKTKMIGTLIAAALGIGGGDDIDIDNITEQDTVTVLIEELRHTSPNAAEVLIDERDAYIAGSLARTAAGGGKNIVAVVGAGHRNGIEKYLSNPRTIPPLSSLVTLPKKRFSLMKVFGIAIVALALATFLLIILSGTSIELLLIAFGWWFIINGTLSALGTIIAGGHPYSIATSFGVAWLTSLNPMMAAGWFAGLVEAKQRHPTTADFKAMMDTESFAEARQNRFFKVVLVAALANIGSVVGTFLGAWVMIQVTGVDPLELIRSSLSSGLAMLGL
ncbi:TraB/GumN family protein [Methanohalophilus portucalensis]|uniref:Pheromone shutdown-related protein TraB n=2 Tax=Methanohalophilus portucalensis TaxID=39664 RepID=A0A1L9C1N7_9EURY|nr:TraB/GumN family protein [Methanohalophilus portucalensis]ATU09140.1 conjugal transfer protein TraB [Methanohalophilus portucalensis]OJH48445.1 TraB family protein [Methanohalophilus portucalensis FDF-1]RNI08543.1 TraB/GumN family protein [Methanohalophilus portucalensis FDF-1]SMH44942.1 pheromone shutdown-related protein TraB [Methanohalophilus portucalensis FDF-1]